MATSQEWGERRAAKYDERVRQLFPAYDELHARAFAAVAGMVPKTAEALVIGAGTGNEAIALANAGYRVVALDSSDAMLKVARGRPCKGEIEFVEGTIDSLAATRRFGAAVSLLVMHFLADDGTKAQYLRAAAARCLPGGVLVLADLVGEVGSESFERHYASWLLHLAATSTEAELERDASKLRAGVHFVPEARISELLRECGWRASAPIWRYEWLSMWCANLE
ncbi:MAG: class I SAM-dependent methyltransferase [Fimbriimonadaceae bacterium]